MQIHIQHQPRFDLVGWYLVCFGSRGEEGVDARDQRLIPKCHMTTGELLQSHCQRAICLLRTVKCIYEISVCISFQFV